MAAQRPLALCRPGRDGQRLPGSAARGAAAGQRLRRGEEGVRLLQPAAGEAALGRCVAAWSAGVETLHRCFLR